MRLTYADIDPKHIERFVNSPMFSAWCERMERKAKEALFAMEREFNAAIADIERRRNAD